MLRTGLSLSVVDGGRYGGMAGIASAAAAAGGILLLFFLGPPESARIAERLGPARALPPFGGVERTYDRPLVPETP